MRSGEKVDLFGRGNPVNLLGVRCGFAGVLSLQMAYILCYIPNHVHWSNHEQIVFVDSCLLERAHTHTEAQRGKISQLQRSRILSEGSSSIAQKYRQISIVHGQDESADHLDKNKGMDHSSGL